jgi:nicotinate-nucleotide adenylyltransferase
MLRFRKSAARPAAGAGRRLGIIPAAFNPPTIAHLEIARAAARQYCLDEVLCLLPQVLPHKEFTGASFEQRVEMLRAAFAGEPQFSIGSTDQGLFIDIARACRSEYGPETELYFICGRDAAERIAHWDYSADIPFAEQLQRYQLLVAPRVGSYQPPPEYAGRIHSLDLRPQFEEFSSSAVRDAIATGCPWEHLVPAAVAEIIRRGPLYSRQP